LATKMKMTTATTKARPHSTRDTLQSTLTASMIDTMSTLRRTPFSYTSQGSTTSAEKIRVHAKVNLTCTRALLCHQVTTVKLSPVAGTRLATLSLLTFITSTSTRNSHQPMLTSNLGVPNCQRRERSSNLFKKGAAVVPAIWNVIPGQGSTRETSAQIRIETGATKGPNQTKDQDRPTTICVD